MWSPPATACLAKINTEASIREGKSPRAWTGKGHEMFLSKTGWRKKTKPNQTKPTTPTPKHPQYLLSPRCLGSGQTAPPRPAGVTAHNPPPSPPGWFMHHFSAQQPEKGGPGPIPICI